MSNSDNSNHSSAIDTYRQHVAARQLYIDKCAVVRNELDNMDQQAVECIVQAYLQAIPVTDFIRTALKGSVASDVSELLADIEMAQFVDSIEINIPPTHTGSGCCEEKGYTGVPCWCGMGARWNSKELDTPTHIDGSDSDSSNRDSDSYGDIVQPSISPAT